MKTLSQSWREVANFFGRSQVEHENIKYFLSFFLGNFNKKGIYGRVCVIFQQKHQLQLNNHSPGLFLSKKYQSHSVNFYGGTLMTSRQPLTAQSFVLYGCWSTIKLLTNSHRGHRSWQAPLPASSVRH